MWWLFNQPLWPKILVTLNHFPKDPEWTSNSLRKKPTTDTDVGFTSHQSLDFSEIFHPGRLEYVTWATKTTNPNHPSSSPCLRMGLFFHALGQALHHRSLGTNTSGCQLKNDFRVWLNNPLRPVIVQRNKGVNLKKINLETHQNQPLEILFWCCINPGFKEPVFLFPSLLICHFDRLVGVPGGGSDIEKTLEGFKAVSIFPRDLKIHHTSSGQIIIFHQPRFPWNKGIPLTKPPFGVRSCEVAIIWPASWKKPTSPINITK